MPRTILWYDLETFGRDPEHDRIAQCAFIRTNEALEEVAPPLVLYCRLPLDYLPDPEACYIHGITPQEVERNGLCEYEFALRILREMSVPNTTVAGYNSIQLTTSSSAVSFTATSSIPIHGNIKTTIRAGISSTCCAPFTT